MSEGPSSEGEASLKASGAGRGAPAVDGGASPFFGLRPLLPDDEAFVCSSFLRSARSEPAYKLMDPSVYYARLKPMAESMARGSGSVACDVEDPWHIFGWISVVAPERRCRYLYVKHTFRRAGIARSLWDSAFGLGPVVVCSHVGRIFPAVRAKLSLSYEPETLAYQERTE